ncbi:DnaJ C-terminal domain-containing protein [Terricaulis silvestris]|uniref:Curved DNA-binding protein n=1 Tax=Terricaulis silvestris TaxID=2686094 RepID=A0A6I6MSN4_9CAUL|nr:DnaJ C-terminal domain-containing protein [Terricaulis silvestris]QGZ95584.1 Curved DNA-binding protein [Terricaulis silvestris]
MSWDPYATLALGRTATADEIRRAYRAMAKELHPDVRPNDKQAEDRFKRATAAFNLLSDPVMKSRYDRGEIDADGNERMAFSSRPRQSARAHAGAGAGPGPGGAGAQDAFDLGDIFSDLFGPGFGNGRSYSRMRGRDIRFTLEVDFLDSINGAKRRVSLAEGRTLDVAIPAGVESGQVLRLKNQGGAGVQGGPAGDALVELTVRPHAFFRREGQDVHMDLNISLTEAVEGGRVQAPTPTGPVTLTIPAGSNTGKTLRLKGKGVAGQGDQFVKLQVMLPETPDEDLKKFVKKWAKRDYVPPRPQG